MVAPQQIIGKNDNALNARFVLAKAHRFEIIVWERGSGAYSGRKT
jgi:hypothetical protein